MSKEWFIVQIKPNAYNRAEKNLNKQGFETFSPMYNITKRKASKFTNLTKPLFSGYMFISFDINSSKWGKINSTYGVSRLITFNSMLKSVPTSFINGLMNRCDISGKLLTEKEIKKGDHVKFTHGPFANLIASVEKIEADQRIWILLNLMGRQTKIETASSNLQLSN
jgi:transcriptional antiterminator RfaH